MASPRDVTSADTDVNPSRANIAPGVNPNRVPGGMAAERGRVNLANITVGGAGSVVAAISEYIPNTQQEQIVGVTLRSNTYSRFLFDPAGGAQALIKFGASTDSALFDQAVQYGNVLYDNAGHQYGSVNSQNTYLWQYPAPNATVQNYAVKGSPSGTLPGATYTYAFTQVVSAPNGGFSQETSSTGSDVPYPYVVNITTTGSVTITGTFAGAMPDGATYVTNVYRQSSLNPTWYLLTTLTSNASYSDNAADATITANAQLIPHRDPPPVSPTNRGAIFLHK